MKNSNEKNYSVVHLGPWAGWQRHSEQHKSLGEVHGRVFLMHRLGLTSSEISLNRFSPGEDAEVYHSHKTNEEIYIFIKGRGQFQVDGETFDVQEGSVVRVSPVAQRVWRAAEDEELFFIVIQAPEGAAVSTGFDDGVVDHETPVKW